MLFDSHAHLNSERYDDDRETVIKAIEKSDVKYVMDIGYDLESSVMAVEHAKKYPWCYAAVGCHPHDTKTMDEMTLVMFRGLAKKPKVRAIGEIGLDYYYNHSEKDVQQYWFRRQIQLAMELEMPIVIHDRDANDDVMRILKQEGAFSRSRIDKLGDAKVLLHCFSGSKELAQQYIKLGATISIAGPLTYKNAKKSIEVVKAIPVEHLLIETDSPYLTPEPLRGKRNQPNYVQYTAKKIAEILDKQYEEVAEITCNNAKKFFAID
ncbi:MAG: TatD family hydrolase [Eubacteriales bacterium]|nr:TatD family hydrolase [Eubacteriales bacterium]MDD3199411.1 TatD family hydrolase [Eubacteriales bacterium]MDD4629921.1 TatD family hydrolase [Eubacteriales bacterium]